MRVFCGEQGVDREAELDGFDGEAAHIVALAAPDGLVGTCRLLFDGGLCKLQRMAIERPWRGRGAGRALIEAAEREASGREATAVLLHAQRRAEGFYAACGYRPEGDTFLEEGIPHVAMRRRLG